MTATEKELVLAPMVRISTLPMRLLCLEYGAAIVFSPEIVDKSIVGCDRIINSKIQTIDYVSREGRLVFRTCPNEKDRLVFQIGSADPCLAVQAALRVAEDVSGINLNCGCPKRFSVQGGMGAALLANKSKLLAILEALVKNIPLPISCKIRLCPTIEETLDLCHRIIKVGVSFIVIHCRTPSQTPRDKADWNSLLYLYEALKEHVKIIVNGDFFTPDDILKFPAVNSFMLARAAMQNPSIFRCLHDEMLPLLDVSKRYLKYAIQTDNPFNNTKFTLLSMWEPSGEVGQRIMYSKSIEDLCRLFKVEEESCHKYDADFKSNIPEPLDYVPDWQKYGMPSILQIS